MEYIRRITRDHLSRLGQFSGRETRGAFWSWIGILFVAYQVVCAFGVGMMIFAESIMGFGPEPITPLPFGDAFPLVFVITLVGIMVAGLVLMAAAVSRRLHDSGLPGWWGLLPVPFLGLGGYFAFQLIGEMGVGPPGQGEIDMFLIGFVNNMAHLTALTVLVLLLVRGSTPGSNRFGPLVTP